MGVWVCGCVMVCDGVDGQPSKRPGSAGELGEGEAAEGGSSHPLNGRRSAPTSRGESVATRRLLGVLGRAKWGAPPGICVGLPGNPRPGPFSSRAESGWSEASRRGEGASRRGEGRAGMAGGIRGVYRTWSFGADMGGVQGRCAAIPAGKDCDFWWGEKRRVPGLL